MDLGTPAEWAGESIEKESIEMIWRYEPDEIPKRKHHWDRDRAGFVRVGVGYVGKCPVSMSALEAQALLDDAIPYDSPRWRRPYPQRLYAVRDGVVYRATRTNPGLSYHGFPEHPSGFPRGSEAEHLKEKLLDRARRQGCEAEVRKWMKW